MNLPTENITFADLGTLAGLALATWILVTAIRQVIPTLPAKITALLLAVLLSLAVALLSGQAAQPQAMLLAVINGALAALLATGGSLVAETLSHPPSESSIASTPVHPSSPFRAWR